MNNLELAIGLLKDAQGLVVNPEREVDINWAAYHNDLTTARRLINSMNWHRDYGMRYRAQQITIASKLRGEVYDD